MNAQRERCVDELADARVDVLLYACLVALMAQGPGEHQRVEKAVREQLPDTAVLSSAGALVDGLTALGARRIGLVMPYLRPLAEQVVVYLEAEGFTVVNWAALEVGDNAEVGCIPGDRLMHAARGLDLGGADALVISACVQMPSLDLVAPAEEELGLPVLSAATAGAYALLTRLGLEPVLPVRASCSRGSDWTGPYHWRMSDNGTGRKRAGASTARRELVENELYEHATRLFAERGFAGTSLQDIADAMGITRPALYYYVKSKDELLAKLVTEVTNGPLDELTALVARGLDPVATLRGIVEVVVRRRATQPERFRLLIRSEAELPEALATAHEASRRAVLRTIAGAIDAGVRSGVFRPVDARVAALGVLGMCNWVAWWFQPGGRDTAESVNEQLADMAVAGLQRPDHQVPGGEGPAAAIKLLRQDLDHLERILDV